MCNTINVVLQFLHNMSVKIVRSSLQEIARGSDYRKTGAAHPGHQLPYLLPQASDGD